MGCSPSKSELLEYTLADFPTPRLLAFYQRRYKLPKTSRHHKSHEKPKTEVRSAYGVQSRPMKYDGEKEIDRDSGHEEEDYGEDYDTEITAYDGECLPLLPTRQTKDVVFKHAAYEEIDERARKAPPPLATGPLQDLVHYLVQTCKNDMIKARAFYVWIASLDEHLFELHTHPPKHSALYRIIMIRAGYGDYNELFADMCSLVEIPCKVVKGRVKGHTYFPGGKTPLANKWCLVYLAGAWRFVDQFFGSLAIIGDESAWSLDTKDNKQKTLLAALNFSFELDDFYFLTNAEQFIYDHYIEDGDMQLLARTVSFDEFHQMARLMQGFFRFKLIDVSEPHATKEINNGTFILQFTLPENYFLKFHSILQKAQGKRIASTTTAGEPLCNFVYIETLDNNKVITTDFPEIGKYKLEVYCSDVKQERTKKYKVGEWILDVNKPNFRCKPNPSNPRGEYGPGSEMQIQGLIPLTHKIGKITVKDGKLEMKFKKVPKDLLVAHTLESRTLTKDDMKDYTRQHDTEQECTINSVFPEVGKYVMKIYTKKKGSKRPFENTCTYLITCEQAIEDATKFPSVFEGQLGHIANTEGIILVPISHPNPIFTAPDDGQVEIKMKANMHLEYSVKLKLRNEQGNEEDCSDYVWTETKPNKEVTFSVVFVKGGIYSFEIAARKKKKETKGKFNMLPKESETDEHIAPESNITPNVKDIGVENSLEESDLLDIDDRPFYEVWKYQITADYIMDLPLPFPAVGKAWKSTFLLEEPRSVFLKHDEDTTFSVKVEDFAMVGVQDSRGNVTELEKLAKGIFKAVVNCGAGGKDLTLVGRQTNGTGLESLAHYRVLTEEEWKKMQEQAQANQREAQLRRERIEYNRILQQELAMKKKDEDEERARKAQEQYERNKSILLAYKAKLAAEAEKEYLKTVAEIEQKSANSERKLTTEQEKMIIGLEIKKIKKEMQSDEVQTILMMKEKEMAEKALFDQLKKATRTKNKDLLSTFVTQFRRSRFSDKNGVFQQAERVLAILLARTRLEIAVSKRDVSEIMAAIDYIKSKNYQHIFTAEIIAAERLIQRLKRLHRLTVVVLSMDKKTMSEIRSYISPPEVVHKVMIASLLLLGTDENKTRFWTHCVLHTSIIGPNGLFKRVQEFEVVNLHPEIAMRAKEILKHLSLLDVQVVSAGAAVFYDWAAGSIEEAELYYQENYIDFDVKPAGVERQMKIFGMVKEEDICTSSISSARPHSTRIGSVQE